MVVSSYRANVGRDRVFESTSLLVLACHAVSKLECNMAKKENGVTTGTFLKTALSGEATMGQLLIADLSVLDVHFQAWMMLVAGIVLHWFIYVWATR